MENRHQSPTDEDSLEGQARRIVRGIPSLPIMYDGTYEEFIDSQESAISELSFSSDSSDSEFTVVGEPIVELPSTPPKEAVEVRTRFQSLDQTFTPGTIGEALEKSGTVLMQRSRENRLAKQLAEMQNLIGADDELVVLKQPSTVNRMHSQPAFTQEVMRGFLEHSETMFHLVHDTQEESNVKEERTVTLDNAKTEAPEDVEGDGEDEFVGCFSKNDDMVMYKRTVKGPRADECRERRESIDSLIAQHAQCLVEADNVAKPKVQIYQSNDENVLALLTFSDQSSAVLKTPSSTVDGVNSYEDLNRVLMQTYRQLLTRPDEMISMQTHHTIGGSGSPKDHPHTHKPRSDLLSSCSNGSARFGLTNGSQSGVCLQGSSKNWNKYPNARNAIEIVTNLRIMLEEFILRKIPPTASVVKFLARLLTDIMHCSAVEVDEEFQQLPLVDKIKQVVDEMLMPHELEDPLRMVNQTKLTMEQILDYPVQVHTIGDFAEACERISDTTERLVCELDHDIEHPDAFVEALQYGLRSLLGSEDSRERLERTLGTSCAEEESHSPHHVTTREESKIEIQPVTTTVCHCFTSWIWLFLGSSTAWLKECLINFWHFLTTTPPILIGPSVSFRETVSDDDTIVQELLVQRNHLNQTLDVLQLVLEKSPSEVKSTEQRPTGNKPTASVNVRSLKLFAQLLQQAGSIELSHSDSHHHLHLQLRESISGNLEKRQTDGICMLAGDIRDHGESVAVCFDARMYDLDTLSENESAIECITRVERLSCDKDEEDVPPGVRERELVVNSVVEDIISTDHFESVKGSQDQSLVEAVQAKSLRETMQKLLEPVIATLRNVQERMEDIGGDRFPQLRVSSSRTITGLVDRLHDLPPKPIKKEERYMNMDVPLAESLQELISMFHDANDRLAMIDCDVTAIRNQVQHLVSEQLQQLERLQHQRGQEKTVKPIQGDGQCTKRRRSSNKQAKHQRISRSSEGEGETGVTCPPQCCPIKQTVQVPPSKKNCPVEIYSCHGVAPDVLVVHWNVDKDVIHLITGYEIHVDGVLRSVCFSNKRRTTLIANINLRQQHQLLLHATPVRHCSNLPEWEPAIFLYHL